MIIGCGSRFGCPSEGFCLDVRSGFLLSDDLFLLIVTIS